jgi:hypothetical protein
VPHPPPHVGRALRDRQSPTDRPFRLTVHHVETHNGRVVRARIGLLETTGRAGEARLEWQADIARAEACDLRGRPRSETPVAITGRSIVVFLRRYEWVHLDLEFA